jgi:4-hydroxybenzoate polyprenyltransferase
MKPLTLVSLIRPYQWYKNLLIFVPLIFSLRLFEWKSWPPAFSAFVSACLVSSAGYIINDVHDLEKDKIHPTKRFRPLPSGEISVRIALLVFVAMAFVGFLLAYLVNFELFSMMAILFACSLLYTFLLKNYVVVDVLAISINYVIRTIAGAYAIAVHISPWLIIGIFFLALLLALGKRVGELAELRELAVTHRSTLNEYDMAWMNQWQSIASALVILTYALYCVEVHGLKLLPTVPIAVYGVMRYSLVTKRRPDMASHPHRTVLMDRPLLASLAVYVTTTLVLLYLSCV